MEIDKISKVKSITETESYCKDNSFAKIFDEKLKRTETVSSDLSQKNTNKTLIDSLLFYGIPAQVNAKKEMTNSDNVISELENYFNVPSIERANNHLKDNHKEDDVGNKNTINKKIR